MAAELKKAIATAVADRKVPGIGAVIVDGAGNVTFKETCGVNDLNTGDAFTADTQILLFSCTKLITTIAALQLVEQGKLSLTDLVEKHVPQIAKVQVLDSFTPGDDPQPVLRAPRSKPTVLQLMTHTAGFTYDFFDKPTLQWRLSTGRAPSGYLVPGAWEDFQTPFAADPGTKYIYGSSTDWLGMVVQAVAGVALPEYLDRHILRPLGMSKTSPFVTRGPDKMFPHFNVNGSLVANPDLKSSESPEVWSGGAFLFSTLNDFAKLLSAILNRGTSHDTGQTVLQPATVQQYLFTDHLPTDVDRSQLGEIGAAIPVMSNEGSFLTSLPVSSRGWSAALLLNHEDMPNRRKKGSGAWAGMGNLYYWIDPASNVAGMIATSTLPFLDPTVLELYDRLEVVAYGGDVDPADDFKSYRVEAPAS